MSHNQTTYYPDEDDDDQQRFFAWNSQAQTGSANHLDDDLRGYLNVGGRYGQDFTIPNYNQPYPLVVAPVPSTSSSNPNTTYQSIAPASTPNPTDLVPTQPNMPSPTSLIPTEPNTPILTCRCPNFSAKEYLSLASVVVDVNPFRAKHGKKAVQWEEVAHHVKAQGFFMNSSTDVVKNKAMALLKYQEVCTLFVFCSDCH
jgi:hypothetical protein